MEAALDALWLIAPIVAIGIAFTAVFVAPLAFWLSRTYPALPDALRSQYGFLVRLGLAPLDSVQESHRAYQAQRRYQLVVSALCFIMSALVTLIFAFLPRF